MLNVSTFGAVYRRWSDQRSCSTLGPVNTGMGDRIEVKRTVWEIYLSLTNHPSQLNVAIPAWVCAMSTDQTAVQLGSKFRYGSCLVAGKTA